jgi:hypothetical protein
MDPFILAAATAIVSSMATEAWQQARSAVSRLWRRARPEGVPAIDGELAEVRGEVLAARKAGDESTEQDLAAEWALKLRRLLTAGDPGLRDELQRLLDEELTPLLPLSEQARVTQIAMTAHASGHGRIYQAGRDQHITGT